MKPSAGGLVAIVPADQLSKETWLAATVLTTRYRGGHDQRETVNRAVVTQRRACFSNVVSFLRLCARRPERHGRLRRKA